jgi:predicted metalloprotease
MRTDDLRPSSNVEDDREASASRSVPGGAGGLSIGAVIIIGLIRSRRLPMMPLALPVDIQSSACSTSFGPLPQASAVGGCLML